MVDGPPSTSAGPSTSYPARLHAPMQQPQQQSNYGFSVHQPYANWPPPGGPYATTWYTYAPQRSLRDAQIQTSSNNDSDATAGEDAKVQYRHHWDAAIARFLRDAGLLQALRGLREDMLVLSEEWERTTVPRALDALAADLTALNAENSPEDPSKALPEKPLDERKLEYVQTFPGVTPQTPSNINKSISAFLAQSRRRNDASNRVEFLQSLSEKRQRMNIDDPAVKIPSCARVDARPLDRDEQMKYDIAKNEDGPLKRTIKPVTGAEAGPSVKRKTGDEVTGERHPGLLERFENLETHLAVRYVPSPPVSLLERVRFLEDHVIALEKANPPWAALHFNQPNRGWPPPPHPTPLIVPSHLTSSEPSTAPAATPIAMPASYSTFITSATTPVAGVKNAGRGRGRGRGKSSLHRAVMERLEVQKAIGDLSGTRS